VGKAAQAITFGALPAAVYGAADSAPGATASSGLTVAYTSSNPLVASIVAGKIHAVGVGSSIITARQAGNTNYAAAPAATQSFTVSRGTQTITFPALPSKVAGEANFAPGATASSKLLVTYASNNPAVATIVTGNVHIVGAGTAIITASQSGDAKWNAAISVAQSLTVVGGQPVINWTNKTMTYGAVLSAVQLNAAASVPGAFIYTPVAGTKPAAGIQTLTVSFRQAQPLMASARSPRP
jgi:hypothetical protein